MKTKVLLIIFFSVARIFAQDPEWQYFSRCFIVKRLADDGENLWIANYSGLIKMNKTTGKTTHFNPTNCALKDYLVNDVAYDGKGNIWVLCNGHLMRFQNNEWTILDNTIFPGATQNHEHVFADIYNNLWVSGSSLWKFDGSNWTEYNTSNSGYPKEKINCLFSEGNNIWMGYRKGLLKFDGSNWITYSNSSISYRSNILDIARDNYGNLWCAHDFGVDKFDGNSFMSYNDSNTNMPNTNIQHVVIDKENRVWVGCSSYIGSDGGIMLLENGIWTIYRYTDSSLSDNDVNDMIIDKEGFIWVGGNRTGMIDRMSPDRQFAHFDPSSAPLPAPYVKEIVFGRNDYPYIGTSKGYYDDYSSGAMRYNWKDWAYIPNHEKSYKMATDSKGNLFIRNWKYIKKYDGLNWNNIVLDSLNHGAPYPPYNSNLNVLFVDHSGGIWIDYFSHVKVDSLGQPNFYEGMAHFKNGKWEVFNSLNSPLSITSADMITEDSKGNIWLCANALWKFDGTNWNHIPGPDSMMYDKSFYPSLGIDKQDNIWIADGHFGFIRYDGNTWKHYPHPYLSPYDCWHATIAVGNDGMIWAGVPLRMVGFDGANWTELASSNSPIPEDGYYSLAIDHSGNLWFGCGYGFMVYKKDGIIPNAASQNVIVHFYPNPFDDYFRISSTQILEKPEVRIYNDVGALCIKETFADADMIELSAKNISSGIYFYQVITKGKVVAKGKVLKG